MPKQLTFEQEVNRLHHRSDPHTSRDAAVNMLTTDAPKRQGEFIYQAIIEFGLINFTAKEVGRKLAHKYGGDYHEYYIMAERRFNELERNNKIKRIILYHKPDGKPVYETREGCCVWQIVKEQ